MDAWSGFLGDKNRTFFQKSCPVFVLTVTESDGIIVSN